MADLTVSVYMTACIWHYRLACFSCTASQSLLLNERYYHWFPYCGVTSTLILQFDTAEERRMHSEVLVGLHQRLRNASLKVH